MKKKKKREKFRNVGIELVEHLGDMGRRSKRERKSK